MARRVDTDCLQTIIGKEIFNLWQNKMKLSLSETDTNVQIILEILNTIINTNGYTAYVPTNVYENEILKKARETVKDRIANRKQRKESKKYARRG